MTVAVQEDSGIPKAVLIEPRSGGIHIATGARAGGKQPSIMMSAVGATV